jgi:hypothetical protein
MIAPLRPEVWKSSQKNEPRMRRARRMLVELLWSDDIDGRPIAPVPAWQAWGITAWIVLVAIVYLSAMIRSL